MDAVQKSEDKAADGNLFSPVSEQSAEMLLLKRTPTSFGRIQIAQLISWVLHPFLVSPVSIVLILSLDGQGFWAALAWALLCAAFVVGPALIFLHRKLKQRQFSDSDVSIRDQRHGFYLFGAICMILCFAILLWLDAPQLLITSFLAALAAVIISAIVTRFWSKVSIHSGVMMGVTTMVVFYSILLALLFFFGTLLVIWSRLVLKRHTLSEAILGGVVAVGCILIVFIAANWR